MFQDRIQYVDVLFHVEILHRVRPPLSGHLGGTLWTAQDVIDPVPYLDMLMLEKHARMILTDSGGVQKEAYRFGRLCVTLRDETEWVELVEAGCNRVVSSDPEAILSAVADFEAADVLLPAERPMDLYGDGHSADHIVEILVESSGRL